MKNLCVLAAWLIAGAAWAAEREPSLSLWIQPLSALTLTPLAASEGNTFLMVPGGANIPLSPTQDLVLEITPIMSLQECEGRCSTYGLSLAVGSSWTVLPNNSGGGFFLQPKLGGVVARDSRGGENTETGTQLSLGLDLGYRTKLGPLFLAFVGGGSVGWGWNVPSSSQSVFFSLWDWPDLARRENKVVWDLNLHLLRIGASF
ncbi:hypothetical protein [Hyalangium versicolor]|uniref:hypothetical protein n=1 Tax=Hyalangium versicolor TaxID=2861190 RepID=UPI001CCEEF3E|nr:hypothetical protein [Hyalangium versicolor]